jgi:outer membrane scaffolding protein for murein synthesis (MipA/OmpV family)
VASDGVSLSGELWPSLPGHGGGVAWALASVAKPANGELTCPPGHDLSWNSASFHPVLDRSVHQQANGHATTHPTSVISLM